MSLLLLHYCFIVTIGMVMLVDRGTGPNEPTRDGAEPHPEPVLRVPSMLPVPERAVCGDRAPTGKVSFYTFLQETTGRV